MIRGSFEFEVTNDGSIVNSAGNVDTLRNLWLDRELIQGYYLGPGDPGDFDNGAWHAACHLAGAGGAMRTVKGQLMWLEISHDSTRDEYFASVTLGGPGRVATLRLDSADGRSALAGATLLGFVEGNSSGRISAKNVSDTPTMFNMWRRQDFDQPAKSSDDGGKVWEHWCTLRDIRPSSRIATSVLTAYVSLVSVLGDRFAPTVARGRREYGHPDQLVALVEAGFTSGESAQWDTKPLPISEKAELLLLQADPTCSLEAIGLLEWKKPPHYFMFKRKIDSWSSAEQVASDLS